jgi:hypothetical protein
MRPVVALGIALLVAGCAQPDAGPVLAEPAPAPVPQALRFEGNYSFEHNEVGGAAAQQGVSYQGPGNCVLLDPGPRILRGVARATWSPRPTDPPMELALQVDGRFVTAQVGAGVAELKLSNLTLSGETELAWQVSRNAAAGASVVQHAQFVLSLDYAAGAEDDPFEVDTGYYCIIDH